MEKRTVRKTIRLKGREYKAVQALAEKEGLSFAAFAVKTLMNKVRRG